MAIGDIELSQAARENLSRLNIDTELLSQYAQQLAVLPENLEALSKSVAVSISSILIPESKSALGTLVVANSLSFLSIAATLEKNWNLAYSIPSHKWEEILAAAFSKGGFDEVYLTPRSGDHGRDVIAIRHGVGCVKIIGSMKAYNPSLLVRYDDVRALLGVISGERDTSKGIVVTTSDFPSKILSDPFIAPFLPTRLELMNGVQLQAWLRNLCRKTDDL